MKLLTKPEATREVIEIKSPARTEVKFHPLGLLGIGPLTSTYDVPAGPTRCIPGRAVLKRVEIDFEDEDAIDLCIDVGAYDFIKKKTEFTVRFEGEVYILHGVLPNERLRDNVWKCSIDYFER